MAFPYLYNNRPRKVRLSAYHYPMVMYIKMEDPDLPAFYYDPLIHPIAQARPDKAKAQRWELDDEELLGGEGGEGSQPFTLPEGLQPFLTDTDLYSSSTAHGIALLWAPRPFSLRSGRMRRCLDVPLINNWFHEHCPQVWGGRQRRDTCMLRHTKPGLKLASCHKIPVPVLPSLPYVPPPPHFPSRHGVCWCAWLPVAVGISTVSLGRPILPAVLPAIDSLSLSCARLHLLQTCCSSWLRAGR